MDILRDESRRPVLVAGIGAFLVGLFFGLVVLGWWLWPVDWYNASATELREDLREDFLRMAIDSYAISGDAQTAGRRWNELGEYAPALLQEVVNDPQGMPVEIIQQFGSVVGSSVSGGPVQPAATQPTDPQATLPVAGGAQTPAAEENGGLGWLFNLFLIVLLLTLGAGGIFWLLTRRKGPAGPPTAAMQAQQAARDAQWTDYSTTDDGPPLAQFMASYKIGDDLFDDSFSIDSPGGEFLGECGVGITETIGVGDPKRVTAFEIWIFDKNDIQTVTKVLMSTHAFSDGAIRQRLAAKGEPVMAEPGAVAALETATLRLHARIVDINYGESALPENSFFDNLILELAIWQK